MNELGAVALISCMSCIDFDTVIGLSEQIVDLKKRMMAKKAPVRAK